MGLQSPPVFAKGRDLAAAAVTLRGWLARRLGDEELKVGNLTYPSGAGLSNETILFEARQASGQVHELVLRLGPAPDYQLFLDPDLRRQYDLITVLHSLGTVRVPELLWYEEDSRLFGQPFFIMRRLHGRVPLSVPVYNTTGWLAEATPGQRRTAWLSAMRQFAAIHTVPLTAVESFGEPARGRTGTEQQLSYWEDLTRRPGSEGSPVAGRILDWLRAHAPDNEPTGLSWGDARIGNMMFGPDFEVCAVLDWEQASLGGAMNDLGWWLYFDHMHSAEYGVARLDGLGTRQETIDLWQELTGRTVGDVHWHEVFAAFKVGVLAVRSAHVLKLMGIAGLPQQSPTLYFRGACRLAGLPEPGEGSSQDRHRPDKEQLQ
jgi:aminoglycoside phosphotransferase (APT) family kinase protein